MKSLINLETTSFDAKLVAHNATGWSHVKLFTKAGPPTGLRDLLDFGTVLVGWDKLSDEDKAFHESWLVDEAPIFSAPENWRMPQLLKALGCFASATAAMKNGWNKDVPVGLATHAIRLDAVKGAITTFKVTSVVHNRIVVVS